MKGTLISIVVGALAGVLLTVGSNVHASRATPSRAAPADGGIGAPAQTAVGPVSRPVDSPAQPDDQAPPAK